MRAHAIGLLIALFSCGSACVDYHNPSGACEGITCAGHGQCRVAGGEATCDCDTGYEPDPDAPLACIQADDGPIFVDIVTGIEDPEAGQRVIHLRDHAQVNIAEGDIQLMFLETSQANETPVYLEIKVASRLIQDVLVPYDSPVNELRDQADHVEVLLVWSAAIHVLMRDHPDFDAMYSELAQSMQDGTHRLVTETRDGHEIIDVRLPLDP